MSSFLKNLQLDIPVTANVTEFKMVTPTLAKAIVVVSQNAKREAIVSALMQNMNSGCYPIQASFRWLQPGRSMIGFLASNQETRVVDQHDIQSNYRVVASNMLMSKEDESLWTAKTGSAGTYLVRNGQDELSSLIEASRISPRGSVPRFQSVIQASAQKDELVCFVNCSGSRLPAVDYGFVIARSGDTLAVVTEHDKDPVNVPENQVVSMHRLSMADAVKEAQSRGKKISASSHPVNAASGDKANSVDYYKKLYSYAPDYLKLVIREIEEMSSL